VAGESWTFAKFQRTTLSLPHDYVNTKIALSRVCRAGFAAAASSIWPTRTEP
jgi:hypothetical protein